MAPSQIKSINSYKKCASFALKNAGFDEIYSFNFLFKYLFKYFRCLTDATVLSIVLTFV